MEGSRNRSTFGPEERAAIASASNVTHLDFLNPLLKGVLFCTLFLLNFIEHCGRSLIRSILITNTKQYFVMLIPLWMILRLI